MGALPPASGPVRLVPLPPHFVRPTCRLPRSLRHLCWGLLGFAPALLHAQTTYYWDTNGNGVGLGSGSAGGTWSTSHDFWNTSSSSGNTNNSVVWSDGNSANFSAQDSFNITVSGTVVVNRWSVSPNNVTTNTFSGGTIDFVDGGEMRIHSGALNTFTISSTLTSSGAVSSNPLVTGTTTLTGSSSFTGGFDNNRGELLYTGSAASLTSGASGTIIVGGLDAELNFTNGADLFAGQNVLVSDGGGSGTLSLTGTGSTGTVTGYLWAGNIGSTTGTINLSSGATLDVGTSYSLGDVATAWGYSTIDGSGTTLDVGANLYVGYSGHGVFTIQNGADVTTENATADNAHVLVATTAGSTGNLTVTGNGSTLDIGGHLWTGTGDGSSATTANVTISDGGAVTAYSSVSIADQYNATDTLTVTGNGSSLAVGTNLYVGYLGDGTASVADGATVTADGIQVGAANDSGTGPGTGSLTIDGSGSTVTSTGATSLGLGVNATADLTVSNSGQLTAGGGLVVGASTGSTGNLTLSSGGLIAIADTASGNGLRGGDGTANLSFNGGELRLNTSAGSALTVDLDGTLDSTTTFNAVDGALSLNGVLDGSGGLTLASSGGGTVIVSAANTFSGDVAVTTGSARVTNATGSAFGTGNVSVSSGATLSGDGSFTGALTVASGGTVAPGNSPGLLEIGSGSNLGGTLLFEIAGADTRGGDYDAIDVLGEGDLTLGGTLSVVFTGDYLPTGAVTWDLLDFTTISGTFGTYDLPTVNGFTWDTTALYTTGELSLSASAVPEPGTTALLAGLALLGFAIHRRRRGNGRSLN